MRQLESRRNLRARGPSALVGSRVSTRFSRGSKNVWAMAMGAFAITALTSCTTPRSDLARPKDDGTPVRIACVGDSITYGFQINDRDHNSYPAQLAAKLGRDWEVRNFGVNGATVLKKGTRPYLDQPACGEALAFSPDVVLIMLGTNDTNPRSWPPHQQDFVRDYVELIGDFQALDSKPRVYLCRPVPIFRDRGKDYDTDKILTEEVIPKINKVAARLRLPVIDLYTPFADKAVLFHDGVHPDAAGAGLLAELVCARLLGHSSLHSYHDSTTREIRVAQTPSPQK